MDAALVGDDSNAAYKSTQTPNSEQAASAIFNRKNVSPVGGEGEQTCIPALLAAICRLYVHTTAVTADTAEGERRRCNHDDADTEDLFVTFYLPSSFSSRKALSRNVARCCSRAGRGALACSAPN